MLREGYESPTPLTVLGPDELVLAAPGTLANALALLPQMRNAQDDGTGSFQFGGGIGRGLLNLRGLGDNRTLVLLDGQRLVANSLTGAPDVSLLPSALVKRVDVLTGGASATYGSDAVAGVVNFVLDDNVNGFRARAEGGISSHADAGEQKLSATWGGDLSRGWRLVTSGEFFNRDGLPPGSRDFATPSGFVPNPGDTPTNGQRPLIVVPNAYDADQSFGGLILNGPLSGKQFLPNGTTGTYAPAGCAVNQPYLQCHTNEELASTFGTVSLTAPQRRATGFARLIFAASPELEARFDTLLAQDRTSITSIPFDSEIFGNLPINVAQNAYLPAAVRTQYLAAGVGTLQLGRLSTDEGAFVDEMVESVAAFSAALDARLAGSWLLKVYGSYSQADNDERWLNAYNILHFLNAVDSVLMNGQPTCRINATAIIDPACVPANVFGQGNMSAASKAYFLGTIYKPLRTSEFTLTSDLSGEPLALPTGVVSVAAGADLRADHARQETSDPQAAFAFSGYPALSGVIRVAEAYVQTVVPLAKDAWLAKSIEADFAARVVRYSQSGTRYPWKLGLSWVPVNGIRFRSAASEDIRAPNIGELYTPIFPSSVSAQINPLPNGVPLFNSLGVAPGQTLNIRDLAGGNSRLVPEVAHTVSVGLVMQPAPLPQFTFSLDHYRIKLDDVITTLPTDTVAQSCAAGNQSQCALITLPNGSSLPEVATLSVNAQSFVTSGVDAEVDMREPLAGGELTLRALVNYLLEYKLFITGRAPQDLRGDISSGLPALQANLSAIYRKGETSGLLSGTYIGGGDYDKAMDAEIENDRVPHVWYVNASLEQRVHQICAECFLYAAVNNLFDQAPPHPGLGIYNTSNNAGFFTGVPYDRIGRYFRVGVRITF